MLPVLAAENFSHRILRGIKLRIKNLDLVGAPRAGLRGVSNPALLAWAADQRRIVLTHDRQTIPRYAYDRIRSHQPLPGIIVVSDTVPTGEAIEVLAMYLECGTGGLLLFAPAPHARRLRRKAGCAGRRARTARRVWLDVPLGLQSHKTATPA
jgi:hypothetical protein